MSKCAHCGFEIATTMHNCCQSAEDKIQDLQTQVERLGDSLSNVEHDLVLANQRKDELEKKNTQLDNELVGECETTSVLTTELSVAETKNKELEAQVKAFEDWLIGWYDAGFSQKKTREQIQQDLKRRMNGELT